MTRKDRVLKYIDLKGTGLELGPLSDPILKKSEANILYVDHTSTEGLKKKYTEHNMPIDSIVDVDYALEGNSLRSTVGKKKFDYVIASHVIEHVPNIVAWLKDVADVLNTGGVLSLVIPDKRYTFDITRNVSRPADAIGDYIDDIKIPSSATIYDYYSEVRKVDCTRLWIDDYDDYYKIKKHHTEEVAYSACLDNLDPAKYVDSHCYVFTPYSFFEILKSLIKFNLLDFEVIKYISTPQNELEFYVVLRKVGGSNKNVAQLLKSIPRLEEPKDIHQLKKENAKLIHQLDDITNSLSWKTTKPLRKYYALLRARS